MAPVIASSSLLETVEQGIVGPVLQSLSCCSDCVRRLGAFVTYLSHSASFHAWEKIAPAHPGTKHPGLGAEQG